MKNDTRQAKWFRKVGFGAFPITWQGWLVAVCFVGMVFLALGLFVTATTVTGAVLAIVIPIGILYGALFFLSSRF